MLFIDADEELIVSEPGTLTRLESGRSYYLEKHYGSVRYSLPALVNLSESEWRWHGPVHEYLERVSGSIELATLSGTHILVREDEGARSHAASRAEKYLRDAQVLEQHLKRHPDDARSQLYLANSYRDAGQPDRAYAAYRRRCSMKGWVEEDFIARLEAGRMAIQLDEPEAVVIEHLLDAFEVRPSRAEPLHQLARYFRVRNRHGRAYVFAKAARELPRPDDRLFIEDDVYRWRSLDELGVAAYWTGRYAECKACCEELLRRHHDEGLALGDEDLQRVTNNLAFANVQLGAAAEGGQ